MVKTHCSKTNFTLHFMFNFLFLVNVENIIYLCCRYCLACVTIATCVFLWLRTLATLSPVVRATQVMWRTILHNSITFWNQTWGLDVCVGDNARGQGSYFPICTPIILSQLPILISNHIQSYILTTNDFLCKLDPWPPNSFPPHSNIWHKCIWTCIHSANGLLQ